MLRSLTLFFSEPNFICLSMQKVKKITKQKNLETFFKFSPRINLI